MSNQRRHFRYDVFVPIYFEKVDSQGVSLHAKRRELFTAAEEARLAFLNEEISLIFEKVFSENTESAMLFYMLNHRMDLLVWLLDLLIEGVDPRTKHDYKFRLRDDAKQAPPKLRENSTIGTLIQAFYNRIDQYIGELLQTVDESVDGKIFLFKHALPLLFNDLDYVKNLHSLAEKGVVQAKILKFQIEKLNIVETIYTRLKLAYQGISNPELWPVEKINISAGGFSVLTNQEYPGFCHLNIFLALGHEVIVCRGKVVMNKRLKDAKFNYKVAVEFDFLEAEYVEFITKFVQMKELEEAMKKYPQGVALPSVTV